MSQVKSSAVFFSLIAGITATLVAAFLSYKNIKGAPKWRKATEYMSSLPLAFPGIVYGLALFWAFLFLPGVSQLLYGTRLPLILAMIFVRLPYCVRMISGNLIQISRELEETSRICGARWGQTMTKIVLPLLRRGLLNSFLYTFGVGILFTQTGTGPTANPFSVNVSVDLLLTKELSLSKLERRQLSEQDVQS